MLTKNEILIKRQGIKKLIKNIINQIKKEKVCLENDRKEYKLMGMYEDCGEFYREQVIQREYIIESLIARKISLEKYAKRLKYEAEEAIN